MDLKTKQIPQNVELNSRASTFILNVSKQTNRKYIYIARYTFILKVLHILKKYLIVNEFIFVTCKYTHLYARLLNRIAYISNLTSPHNLHFY